MLARVVVYSYAVALAVGLLLGHSVPLAIAP
jgi:hypothetical protein